jgi:hypothetical protein
MMTVPYRPARGRDQMSSTARAEGAAASGAAGAGPAQGASIERRGQATPRQGQEGGAPTAEAPSPGADAAERQMREVLENAAKQREFLDLHVYGAKSALCFSADETAAGHPTVRIEAAPALGGRRYDWGAKIALQATAKELPQILAVLMGWAPSLVLKNHGPAADKGLKLEVQGGNVFCGLWQQKRAFAVPITAPDAYFVTDLVLRQLRRASPHLSSDAILELAGALAKRMSATASRPA